MTEAPVIWKPVYWFADHIFWFPYDRNLRHKRVKSFSYERVKNTGSELTNILKFEDELMGL